MLKLQDVSLVCIDTRHTAQARQALLACMAHAEFGEVLFFCTAQAAADGVNLPGIRHIPIEPLRSIQDYSRFMLQRLGPHVHTEHALCIQWDGYFTRPELWTPDFLTWDYIGAPWVYKNRASEVGNGGFSLRSKALLQATMALSWDGQEPEDVAICRTMRPALAQQFGLKFAPLDVAERFSHEYGPVKESFGFHGLHNFAHRLPDTALADWVHAAPDDLITHWHARNLIKQLILLGRGSEARALIHKRAQLRGWQIDDLVLSLRSCLR
jgi:hypothetical protein